MFNKCCWAFQVALVVKNSSANAGDIRDAGVWSLDPEDPLEEGMATHSSILALENPMDRRAWQAIVLRVARVRHDWSDWACTHTRSFKASPRSLPLVGRFFSRYSGQTWLLLENYPWSKIYARGYPLGFPDDSVVKNQPVVQGDGGSIPRAG